MKTTTPLILSTTILILMALIFTACGNQNKLSGRNAITIYLSDTVPEIDKTRETKILTAFFGLDNGLTQRARLIYKNAPGQDGMPLVFSHELDPESLEGADFAVTTQNGTIHIVEAASFLPANEEFELRTVLLIGEYGNHPDNPPVSVKVVGDLMARTGQNFRGDSIEVIPLPEGPVLSYAEYFTIDKDYPYIEKGDGCDCPKEETKMVVKAVWSGGVRALNGEELGENEKDDFIVTLVNGTDTVQLTPFKLADLGDNENNIDLCLKESGIPILVAANGNIAIDPNNDPNPKTSVKVVSRW
ncbi:MAG: hypothetical protein AAFY45_06535 [Bacteroidota bacterium]